MSWDRGSSVCGPGTFQEQQEGLMLMGLSQQVPPCASASCVLCCPSWPGRAL